MLKRSLTLTLIAALLGIALTACVNKQTPLPEAKAADEVAFFDSGSFDKSLSAALRTDSPDVTVIFPAAITLNSIPRRMDHWLSKVEEYEGKVNLVPVQDDGKGIFSEALSFMVTIYDYLKDIAIYSPVEDYDAFIYYRQGNGIVDKIVFARKDSATGQ